MALAFCDLAISKMAALLSSQSEFASLYVIHQRLTRLCRLLSFPLVGEMIHLQPQHVAMQHLLPYRLQYSEYRELFVDVSKIYNLRCVEGAYLLLCCFGNPHCNLATVCNKKCLDMLHHVTLGTTTTTTIISQRFIISANIKVRNRTPVIIPNYPISVM